VAEPSPAYPYGIGDHSLVTLPIQVPDSSKNCLLSVPNAVISIQVYNEAVKENEVKFMKTKILRSFALLLILFVLAACDVQTTTTISTTTTATTSTTTSSTTTSGSQTTLRQFTLSELAAFNGDGGTTAYMAVNGIVYDVTNAPEWTNGWHKGMHLAGTDATAAFADSPHSASFLNQLEIIGTLIG
jgi:predicted heme/steroid binding protein